LDSVKGNLSDAQAAVTTKLDRTATATYGYVRENPWRTLGGAVLVGVIVGLLVHRR